MFSKDWHVFDAIISIKGCYDSRSGYNNSAHYIKQVTLKNIEIEGNILLENYPNLVTYMVKELSIINDSKVTGAKIKTTDSSKYGSGYIVEVL